MIRLHVYLGELLFLLLELVQLLLQLLHLVLLLVHVVEEGKILILVLHERSNLWPERGEWAAHARGG